MGKRQKIQMLMDRAFPTIKEAWKGYATRRHKALHALKENPFLLRRKVMEELHFALATPLVKWQYQGDPRITLGQRTRIQGVDILQADGPEARITIDDDVVLYRSCQLVAMGTGAIEVGKMCTLGSVQAYSRAHISIGDFVLCSFGVFLQDYDPHAIDPDDRRQELLQMRGLHVAPTPAPQARPICIEDNVWIGANVTILKGVTIGRESVIGAGSVVTKDIPPRCIAAGNPARVIRTLDSSPETSTRHHSWMA